MNQVSAIRDKRRQAREDFEDHFYATWPPFIRGMGTEELERLNADKLADVNGAWPETMLWLKSMVLQELAEREYAMKAECEAL